jgi:hypothetical protein
MAKKKPSPDEQLRKSFRQRLGMPEPEELKA